MHNCARILATPQMLASIIKYCIIDCELSVFFFYLIAVFSTNVLFVFQADLKERYTVKELLADLAGCKATRVLLFVDQSYSGVLSKRLRGSQKHPNVVLIQGQAWQSYSHQRLNPVWEESDWSYIKPATCLLDHFGKVLTLKHVFSFTTVVFMVLMLFSNTDPVRAQWWLACWNRGPAS